jgi:hypothetical protein
VTSEASRVALGALEEADSRAPGDGASSSGTDPFPTAEGGQDPATERVIGRLIIWIRADGLVATVAIEGWADGDRVSTFVTDEYAGQRPSRVADVTAYEVCLKHLSL